MDQYCPFNLKVKVTAMGELKRKEEELTQSNAIEGLLNERDRNGDTGAQSWELITMPYLKQVRNSVGFIQ